MLQRKQAIALVLCAAVASGLAGAYDSLAARAATPHQTLELHLQVSPGYAIRRVADQFTAPVGVAVDDRGEIYVAEEGRRAGTQPRVIRLGSGNKHLTVASDFPAPLTGLTWQNGKLYVAYVGGVDLLDPATGNHHPILAKLPAQGDYANSAVTFGPDGKMYFGIGTATNSGVIGQDNLDRGWVTRQPGFRDIPCQDVKVRGTNFTIPNPLTKDPLDMAATGAFSAFGTTTARSQVIKGTLPCTGAIFRADPDGADLALVAWGLRNPAGLHFGPDGELYFTMQGFEERGSRPIVGDRDYFYRAVPNAWYGWPDFAGNRSVANEQFQKPSLPAMPLLAERPGQPPLPITSFPHGSGAAGLLFPPANFGLEGDALAALSHSGTLVRVNPRNGNVTPFLKPAPGGDPPDLVRPVAMTATSKGTVLLLDSGTQNGTGALWQIDWAARK